MDIEYVIGRERELEMFDLFAFGCRDYLPSVPYLGHKALLMSLSYVSTVINVSGMIRSWRRVQEQEYNASR
jgi:hypothetical protein